MADRRVEVDKLEIWLSVINTDGGVSLEKRDDLYGASRDVGSHRDLVSGTTVGDEVFYGRRTMALVDNTPELRRLGDPWYNSPFWYVLS